LFGRRHFEILVEQRQVADLDHRAVEIVIPDRAHRPGDLSIDATFAKASDDDPDLVTGHGALPFAGKRTTLPLVAR
jgi:hypothetical protein